MTILVWLALGTTWAGHVAFLLLPPAAVFNLLTGQATGFTHLALWSSLLPQLYLIPWAWRDCGRHIRSATARRLWRLSYFFTGFLAVTVYAWHTRPHRTS